MNKERLRSIRVRTWVLTASIIVGLLFYSFVALTFDSDIDYVSFIIIATIQVVTHFIYFPDGAVYGTNYPSFQNNKKAYNLRAYTINNNHKVTELREYCDYEYNERKAEYIRNECGAIGIGESEYKELQRLSPTEVKALKQIEIEGKILYFTKETRKRLYALLYKAMPLERNHAETILSANEYDGIKAITDGTIGYTAKVHIRKLLLAFVVGLFLAYIGYKWQDGINAELIVQTISIIVSMVVTAVLSFSQGETSTSVYKNKFYVELSNYIDCFIGWLAETKNIILDVTSEKSA